ncbi:MAG: hypothetical protein CVT73_05725 [Alphaproteobacteria bacterium HGW-Alphaproteobacteria-12]|nr:MAG: hypothetical protein CVT73_05725 [Alphaproteobacteria bacterium HGW-Alphaproteobacteria-12]
MSTKIDQVHEENARRAKELYLVARNPEQGAVRWHEMLRSARRLVAASLRASNYLIDVQKALEASGSHMRVFRQLIAPPMSQDQFKLLCDNWSKRSENIGSPLSPETAAIVASTFSDWCDPAIGKWRAEERPPTRSEVRSALLRTSILIAQQDLATRSRNEVASVQEHEVTDLLENMGWKKLPSKLIDTRASVPEKHYMHKTRFATKTASPQEVDIACGLAVSHVLAMECKVTNDETNSVKRVNDVIKKANAWREHFGSFVETAALLQGVIAPRDVQRLSDNGIHVFWSHDLEAFRSWLLAHIGDES